MLLKDAQAIKDNLSNVENNINFKSWKSAINLAEKQDIIPYISQAYYTELNTAYNAEPPTLSGPDELLLTEYLQPCLAFYAAKNYLMQGTIVLGERIGLAQNEHLMPATPQELKVVKMKYLESADILLESMLAFLEENKANYPSWAASSAYTEERSLFIRNAEELNKLISLGAGNPQRRLYLKIKSELRNAEKILERNLTTAFFNDLKAKHLANTLSEYEETAVDKAKAYIANIAMSNAVTSFAKYWHWAFFGGELDKDKVKTLKIDYKERSEERMSELLSYLNNTASTTVFSLFLDSNNYIEPPALSATKETDNSNSSTFFV